MRYSGQSFNQERYEALKRLGVDAPQPVLKKQWYQVFRAQGASIKASYNNRGGHLSTNTLSYIRIPKAANTSLSYAVLVKQLPQLQSATESEINFLADANLKPATEATTETFFTVVRDPFKRLVSVYRDFFESDHSHFIYQDYLFGILPKKLTFPEFVDRVNKIPDPLKDQHLKPQHYFLKPYQQQGISPIIFQLEEREKLQAFMTSQGLELTHRNKSGEAYDYTQYYTPHLLDIVYEMYRTDIEMFGYAKAYEVLKSQVR